LWGSLQDEDVISATVGDQESFKTGEGFEMRIDEIGVDRMGELEVESIDHPAMGGDLGGTEFLRKFFEERDVGSWQDGEYHGGGEGFSGKEISDSRVDGADPGEVSGNAL
jgi:hypothetical protein